MKTVILEKIKDSEEICMCPEHNPPTHIVLEAGTYKHTCPSCGKEITFVISPITN